MHTPTTPDYTTPLRLDPRYVTSDDPRAVLRAFAGHTPSDATMDMGGWLDDDVAAFTAAVQDEALHGTGEQLQHVDICRVIYDVCDYATGESLGGVASAELISVSAAAGPEGAVYAVCSDGVWAPIDAAFAGSAAVTTVYCERLVRSLH